MTGIEIATSEPAAIVAGDSLKWDRADSDFPAPTWTLTYQLVGRLGSHRITTTQSGQTHQVRVTPAVTLKWKPGAYRLVGRVSDGTDAKVVYDEAAQVTASLLDQGEGFDPRSQNERILDAINATIEGRASKDQQSYSIQGRSLSRMTADDLLKMKNHYEWRVRMEKRPGTMRRKVRFG